MGNVRTAVLTAMAACKPSPGVLVPPSLGPLGHSSQCTAEACAVRFTTFFCYSSLQLVVHAVSSLKATVRVHVVNMAGVSGKSPPLGLLAGHWISEAHVIIAEKK